MPPPNLRYSYISRSKKSKNAKNSANAFSIPVLLSTFVVALFVLNLLRMPSAYVEDNIELQQSSDSSSSSGEETPIDMGPAKPAAAAAAAEVSVSSSTATDEEEAEEAETSLSTKPFEILCTTERRIATGGAYLIRCRDFERMVRHCTKDVNIALYTHNELVPKANVTYNASAAEIFTKQFDATVTIKFIIQPNPRFGRLFLDVVDRYKLKAEDLVEGMEVIVQNDYHGSDIYANKKYHVVEHWYNSFPEDMLASADIPGSFPLPEIKPIEDHGNNHKTMRMIIVWTNRIQPCPELTWDHPDVTMGCIHRKFRIETWYHMELPAFNTTSPITYNETEMKRLEGLLADPDQGTGRIYYEIFWLFDVLVVPAKLESEEKLRYGNVQRAISQMRSGVPVLLEVYGDVLEDFMMRYNYTCAYTRPDITFKLPITRKFWSLDEATVAMKDVNLRKQCQQEGLTIAKDYSPARLVERELRILGYQGKFNCP